MTENELPIYDHFAIEREARRLRAEAAREGLTRFWAWLRKPRSAAVGGRQTA